MGSQNLIGQKCVYVREFEFDWVKLSAAPIEHVLMLLVGRIMDGFKESI